MAGNHKRSKEYRGRKKFIKFENKTRDAADFLKNLLKPQSDLSSDNCESDIEFEKNGDTATVTDCDEEELSFVVRTIKFYRAKEIQEIISWIVNSKIPHVHADKLLKILQRRLLPELPLCTKTLLQLNNIKFDIESMEVSDNSLGQFYYFGIKKRLEATVNSQFHESSCLELMFNIDGVSPFTSSSVTMWPTLCKIYTKEDAYEPFSVSVYSGHGKPKSAAEYLKQFVIEMNTLQHSGIDISNKHYKVKIKCFICDCPARSYVKCSVGHVAFKGCERCKVLGEKINNVTVFLQTNAERKTDSEFRLFKDPEYHTGVSLLTLIEPPINMLSQFILDPMHLLYLGCTNRILEYLLKSTSSHKVRLSATMKIELQRRSQEIQKNIPDEFPRKMRPTNDYAKYKAVELKFFTLYAAPFLFRKILPKEVYEHLLLFTSSCRLLSEKEPLSHVTRARQNFIKFVNEAPTIYGSTFVSLNIHNLIHVADDVESTKCNLNEISAFAFESYLGKMTSLLRSPTHLVAQYGRRLAKQEKYSDEEPSIPKELEILAETKEQILKIKYKGMILTNNQPNSTVLLHNGQVAEIIELKKINNVIHLRYKTYLKKLSTIPDSEMLNAWEVKRLSSDSLLAPIDHIEKKFVKFEINFSKSEENRLFVIPLLH